MAAVLITLGIGSIRARRWARVLSLILGWGWLLVGIIAMVVYAIVLPKTLGAAAAAGGQPLPEAAKVVAIVVAMTIFAFIFILLPGAIVLFYQGKHVKATCAARDPIAGWTDACPLPVLALALWIAFGGLFMLLMPPIYHGVAPFFGVLISGIPGTLFYLAISALWMYSAWTIYHLKVSGWWVVLIVTLLFSVSNLLTFTRVDLMQMYRMMGYPEAQIEQLQRLQFLQSGAMIWMIAGGFLPLVLYLLYVRRFFRKGQSQTMQGSEF
jgi:hypothetical protein